MHGSGLELALVFLLAAVIAVPVFKRFGLGAVLAYLVAGVVLGPDGLALVRDADRILNAAEIGVVMMLFVIGLELSPSRLRVMRKPVFGAGGLQVLLSALLLVSPRAAQWRALRLVPVGGEALPGEVADSFARHFDAELRNHYGPTEAVVCATHMKVQGAQGSRVVPIGAPNRNVYAYAGRVKIFSDAAREKGIRF